MGVAGLRLNDGSLETPNEAYGRGWSRVLFAPGCVTDPRLPAVKARITTMHGAVSSSRANQSDKIVMEISLPPNVVAEVRIPPNLMPAKTIVEENGNEVWNGGRFISGVPGLHGGFVSDEAITLKLGSGSYHFV